MTKIKICTRFYRSTALQRQTKADHDAVLPLVREYNRLNNLFDNAKRDVDMWGRRVKDLTQASEISNPPKDLTRPIEVATEQFELAKKTWAGLCEVGSAELVGSQRVAAACALVDQLTKISAGSYDWRSINASREKKIHEYDRQVDALVAEMREHRRAGMKFRRDAVKQLELHNATSAVSLIVKSQKELADAASYPPMISRIQSRREWTVQQTDVAMLAEWLRTLIPRLEELLKPPQLAEGGSTVA